MKKTFIECQKNKNKCVTKTKKINFFLQKYLFIFGAFALSLGFFYKIALGEIYEPAQKTKTVQNINEIHPREAKEDEFSGKPGKNVMLWYGKRTPNYSYFSFAPEPVVPRLSFKQRLQDAYAKNRRARKLSRKPILRAKYNPVNYVRHDRSDEYVLDGERSGKEKLLKSWGADREIVRSWKWNPKLVKSWDQYGKLMQY